MSIPRPLLYFLVCAVLLCVAIGRVSISDLKDVIAEMSNQRVSEQIQAFVSGRNFDKSVFKSPVKENIGILPELWQILWSSRIARLPHDVWSTDQ